MERLKKNILELTHCSLGQYREMKKFPVSVMLDNIRSMHNVGSVLRTADAFLLSEVILCGITGCPPHPEISKTALGAEESVKWTYFPDPLEILSEKKKEDWRVCVLEQTHGSIPLQDFSPKESEKYLLIAGNEVEGVSQEIVDLSDIVLEIPQFGVKHSLNVSVSVGIALWQLITPYLNHNK